MRSGAALSLVIAVGVSGGSVSAQTTENGNPPCNVLIDLDCDGLVNGVDALSNHTDDPDVDGDGIWNFYDKNPYLHEGVDPDNDGIPNYMDQDVYSPEVSDVDKDGIENNYDWFPYDKTRWRKDSPESTASEYVCSLFIDHDCDGIRNTFDRFPRTADLVDADYDGILNYLDAYPYVPFVRTDIAALLASDPNYCNINLDNDCDGVSNPLDPDDFVAEFADADGDGIPNKRDEMPYFNPATFSSLRDTYSYVVLEPSKRFYMPPIYNSITNSYRASSIFDLTNRDDDGDGIPNSQDPYRYHADWDNDGKLDGYDPDIHVNEEKVEEERLEEKRLEEDRIEDRQDEQRLEEKRLDQVREDERLEENRLEQVRTDKTLETQRLEQKLEQQRQDEKRQQDRRDEQRRQAQRDEQRRQAQRDELRRQQQSQDY